jgi:hypothetical protein
MNLGNDSRFSFSCPEYTVRKRGRGRSGDGNDTEIRPLTLSYLWPRELEHLFARAGLTLLKMYGDFERTPFGPGSQEMVWVAKRS